MDLGDDADILAAAARHRHDRLHPQLHLRSGPDDAGVDGADRLLPVTARRRRRERDFNQRRKWLTHSGSPRSRTCERRYSMLYSTANPYWTRFEWCSTSTVVSPVSGSVSKLRVFFFDVIA